MTHAILVHEFEASHRMKMESAIRQTNPALSPPRVANHTGILRRGHLLLFPLLRNKNTICAQTARRCWRDDDARSRDRWSADRHKTRDANDEQRLAPFRRAWSSAGDSCKGRW